MGEGEVVARRGSGGAAPADERQRIMRYTYGPAREREREREERT